MKKLLSLLITTIFLIVFIVFKRPAQVAPHDLAESFTAGQSQPDPTSPRQTQPRQTQPRQAEPQGPAHSPTSQPDLILPELDHWELSVAARKLEKQGRYLFAYPRPTDVSPHTAGHWTVKDGQAQWQYHLRSTGAESLNLAFSEFRLPPTATLTISDPTGQSKAITFTSRDNDAHGQLWTPIFRTDELLVSLDLPTALASDYRLRLAKTNHGFRSKFSKKVRKAIGGATSGSCNIDVICSAANDANFGPLIDLYRDQIRSVAAYTLGGIETCSGALINNARNDLTPYFLTADHCGINFSNAPSIVVYWNFENSVCRRPNSATSGANGDGPITQFNSGSIYRAGRERTDFCLIELDDPVDPSFEPFFAGWDRSGANPNISIGIHHPGVSEKRISFELDTTTTTAGYEGPGSGTTHVRVADWDFGTTEGGSSGSPLFDEAGRIIGQLDGGAAACGNNLPDWYGRLSRSWADGSSSSSRLSDWLDPDNTGVTAIDGINAIREITIADATVTEGNSGTKKLNVTLSLSEPSNQIVSVLVTAQGASAVSGDDFLPYSDRVFFQAGQRTRTASIDIVGDTVPEENESFTLALSSPENAEVSGAVGTVIIINDDFIAPVVDSPLTAQAFTNSPFQYQITALNTPNSFSLVNAPIGMNINSISGNITWIPTNLGTVDVTIIATNSAGSDSRTLSINVTPNSLAAALELPSTITLSNASPGWSIQAGTTFDGIDAAQADTVGDNQNADFSIEAIGPDLLEYRYKVSSEEDFDFLSVNLDGIEQNAFSGEVDWQAASLVIPEGTHVITFSYVKDGNTSEGDDTAWLDSFEFIAETGRPAITSPSELLIDADGQIDYLIESIATDATFTVTGLPAVLTFDGDRTITGTLNTPGTYLFQIRALSNGVEDILDVTIRVATPVGEAVELVNLPWTRQGAELWFGQSITTFDGIDAAQSGDIGNDESTSMSITITGPDRLSFYWKVSSEERLDQLSFLFDGEVLDELPSISGEQDWTYAEVEIPSGSHVLTWQYSKDDSISDGDDTAWLDDIRFANGRRPMISTIGQPRLLRRVPATIPLEFVNADSYSFTDLPDWLTYREETDELIGIPPSGDDIEITATAIGGGETFTRIIPLEITIPSNILDTALGQSRLAVTTSRAGSWFRNTSGLSRNPRSGTIGDSESSSMTLLVQGPGTLSFDWQVSSEPIFDVLSYSLNGIVGAGISGSTNWQNVQIDLAPGQNQLTWTFRKDGDTTVGQDFGEVRSVVLTGYAQYLNDERIDHYSSRPTDDEDGNGVPIILEYAFGIEGGDPATFPPLNLINEAGQNYLEFEAPTPAADVSYFLESSPNLNPQSWIKVPGTTAITPSGDVNRYRLPITLPRANTKALFYRMRIGFQ